MMEPGEGGRARVEDDIVIAKNVPGHDTLLAMTGPRYNAAASPERPRRQSRDGGGRLYVVAHEVAALGHDGPDLCRSGGLVAPPRRLSEPSGMHRARPRAGLRGATNCAHDCPPRGGADRRSLLAHPALPGRGVRRGRAPARAGLLAATDRSHCHWAAPVRLLVGRRAGREPDQRHGFPEPPGPGAGIHFHPRLGDDRLDGRRLGDGGIPGPERSTDRGTGVRRWGGTDTVAGGLLPDPAPHPAAIGAGGRGAGERHARAPAGSAGPGLLRRRVRGQPVRAVHVSGRSPLPGLAGDLARADHGRDEPGPDLGDHPAVRHAAPADALGIPADHGPGGGLVGHPVRGADGDAAGLARHRGDALAGERRRLLHDCRADVPRQPGPGAPPGLGAGNQPDDDQRPRGPVRQPARGGSVRPLGGKLRRHIPRADPDCTGNARRLDARIPPGTRVVDIDCGVAAR